MENINIYKMLQVKCTPNISISSTYSIGSSIKVVIKLASERAEPLKYNHL